MDDGGEMTMLQDEVAEHLKASRQGTHAGLLQQYIETKMAKAITSEFINSVLAPSIKSKIRMSTDYKGANHSS